ncbi:MAG: hypothetical protein V1494_07845 [Candidatus Diapherotrites archaeon]
MGWYGVFLVPKLKLCFYLRSVDQGVLESHFESLDRFFDKHDKLKEDSPPTDSSNVYTSGYCCSGTWQTTSCTPAQQCTVNIATPCTISIAGGTINSCTQQNLIYQYNATTTVNNTVNGLQASKAYNIKIENTTTGATQNKTVSTNSAGVLQFSN